MSASKNFNSIYPTTGSGINIRIHSGLFAYFSFRFSLRAECLARFAWNLYEGRANSMEMSVRSYIRLLSFSTPLWMREIRENASGILCISRYESVAQFCDGGVGIMGFECWWWLYGWIWMLLCYNKTFWYVINIFQQES